MGTRLNRVSTGITGLDQVLHGGLRPERSYMVRGAPGTGKSLLGLHFLVDGVESGETALYINLEETTADIRSNAVSIGLDVDQVEFLDLTPAESTFTDNETYDVFTPDEVESESITDAITQRVASLAPERVVIDPMTQLQYLAPDDYQFRKQVLALTRYFGQAGATVLFTSQVGSQQVDETLQFMADGVIDLGYAETGRTISVPKFRGSDTRSGQHTMRIRDTGIDVYPELRPGDDDVDFEIESLSSGLDELDQQLNGGIERGTVTIISGPTGAGKTTTGTQFASAAAERGERSALYLFEETEETFLKRSSSIGMPVEEMQDRGMLAIEEVEALELSPQEFAYNVRTEVESMDTSIVMIDGISGYRLSIRGGDADLRRKLHSLCRYLKGKGIAVILIDEVGSVTGDFEASDGNLSYLADNILFLRHVEIDGELRKVAGVLKKRTSAFERTLREFDITEDGIKLGEPLSGFHGILSGTPQWTGDSPDA